ncbi:MAG: tetrathionate reductase family octaheme c-type cytochrome [Desulfobacterales bacterium]|jgi:octaheme c-type cytochrome (tetrathionate reductase family)|nr:tetrathionate reductase family octaheme c-type cytochrome [Desulfobacterales bacterium]
MANTSNWCRCTSCHAGYGWEDATFDFTNAFRIDCLICHDTTRTYEKIPTACGKEKPGLNLVNIAQTVGKPSRATCGACHFCGGGCDGVKHGDLDSTMISPDRSHDVHMGGKDFSCQECHKTTEHKIAGASTTCAVSEGRVRCEDCHPARPHDNDNPVLKTLNDHGDAIACQTCHIPVVSKAKPTMIFWDWSKAGDTTRSNTEEIQADGTIVSYNKIKGEMITRKNIKPDYAWYNGMHRRYLLGDPVNRSGSTCLNPPLGNINDPKAKITPYKRHHGVQPADAEYGYLVVPKLFKGYWDHFDWNKATEDGMKAAGLKYSGKLAFVKTDMYWRLNHEIAPKENALSCTDCHRKDGVIDFKALGYAGDPAVTGGRKTLNAWRQ